MLGILAFGSIRKDPGKELEAATKSREPMMTPFRVEFARVSEKRGRAPTLVPVVSGGASVQAEVLVLNDSISEEDAASILWRRETGQIGSGRSYTRPSSPRPNQMLVDTLTDHEGFARVLYTNFPESGKLSDPEPSEPARLAIGSVSRAPAGKDGISYLIAAKADGIETPLMARYEAEILRQTGALTLEDALARCQAEGRRRGH
jgi:hypothetical protein